MFSVKNVNAALGTVLSSKELSFTDDAYPAALLADGLKDILERVVPAVVDNVYNVLLEQNVLPTQVQFLLKKGYRYVVDMDEDTRRGLEEGRLKLVTEHGKMTAQIREANGQYGPKLPIKKEYLSAELNPLQVVNILQINALQDKLQIITEQINMIDIGVQRILQGQQNDRIGLYYSGMNLYQESKYIADNELKNALTAQALRALSEAAYQLTLTMQSDIQYLVDKKYREARGNSAEVIKERMNGIKQSFAVIHQAFLLRAGIYCELNELAAMSMVLDGYAQFIENTIAKHADRLVQWDEDDDGTEKGFWRSRAKLRTTVSDLTRQLNATDKPIYLSIV